MRNFSYLLILSMGLCCFNIAAWAQSRSISGSVTDAAEDTPLPGVNIVVKGTTTGTVTDIEGNYRLTVPADAQILVFSSVGYTTEEVEIGNRSEINLALDPDVQALQEVVVTSLGIEQEKQALGYAVQELESRDIEQTRQPNIVNALQGQVAGVQITNSGGAPGMSSRIIIRGITSLNPNADNQPLFVVDGVPIDNSTIESEGTPRGMSNRAADINPNDIESLNVLKGSAATALYGVRAANGAVIITTKKGRAGDVRVNFSNSIGFDQINQYPDFQEQYGQGFSGNYNPTDFWPSWGAPIPAVRVIDPEHRYYDNTRNLMRTGRMLDNNVSVSGGNENATFYASFSNLNQQGVIPNSYWNRTSAKLSGKADIGEKFDLTGSLNYINSGGNRVPHDRMMEDLMYWAFTQDVTDYINPDGTMRSYGNNNALYRANFATYEDDVNRVIGNLNFNYRPTEWLSFNYRIGMDTYSDARTEILPGPLGIEGEVPLATETEAFMEERRINRRDLNSTLNVTLNHTFQEKFDVTLRLGNDVFDRREDRVRARGNEFVVPRFFNLNNTVNIENEQYFEQRRLVGVYGDLLLDYDDFLYLNITGRNDWTSTLARENRSFFYPSINLGFVFNDVLNLPEVLSYGKLRASYAEVGKDADPYSTSVTYTAPTLGSTQIFPLNDQVGFTRGNSLGLEDLQPERTVTWEFGTDLRFFNDRLSLDFTYYKSNSRDQIIPVPVSDATGYTTFITNAGELENRGVELIARGTIIQTPDFSWETTVNFTRNRNEVVEIREGIENIVLGSQFGYVGSTVTMQLIEGDPYGNLYGSSYARYYAGGAPEDLRYLDKDQPLLINNGFPVYNSEQLIIGNAQPDWLGGIRNTFTYKGVSLSFLIDARVGNEQYDQFGNFYSAFGMLDYSLNRNDVVIFDGILQDGSSNSQQVWLGQGIGPDGRDYGAGFYREVYRRVSENFVKDASFVKLRNLTIGYELPTSILDNTPFSTVNASVTANNIILWTPWRGYDPESFSAGAQGNATAFTGLGYPGIRSLIFSLNFSF